MILKNINLALKKEFEAEPIDIEDLSLISSFVQIILSYNLNYIVPHYRKYVPIDSSINYSLEFLNSINKNYAECLMNAFGNDDIIIKKQDTVDEVSKVIYDKKSKEKKIEFIATGTIHDSYSLTHELVHYKTVDLNNITTNWEYTTEGYAMTMEALQKDYFKKYPYRVFEYKYNERANLLGVLEKACMLDFEINLMKLYMIKKNITDEDIHILLDGKSDDYIYYASCDMKEISDRYEQTGILYLNFMYLQRYIIGYLISTHILERINQDRKYIDQFIELNDNSNNMSFIDTLKELDLEVVDKNYVILSDDSLKQLKKEYKKRIVNL